MTLKQVMRVFCLLAAIGLLSSMSYAQDVSALWMKVYGDAGAVENLSFGNRIGNSFGVDSTQPFDFKELEPPPPSPGFDCIWVIPPGRTGQWGAFRGLLRRDWRFSDGNAFEVRKDTFVVQFNQNDNSSATISFKWPDAAYLAAHCDSIFLFDQSGVMGWPGNLLNMMTTDTLDVPGAGDNGVNRFRIYKYNKKLVETHVRLENPTVPGEFALSQNYPNPFNPTTTMTFDILTNAATELAIYNVLGQKVATLLNEQLAPGTYSTVWHGTTDNNAPVASGIYYARLTARAVGAAEPFTALRKLLLMK